ncbi:SIS domain-containing protein [Pendulispora albinea]|uniref:SIS domain-containing protein n=1 Tax=Pendulispora albinea TaxID=2741071 RepID=A0ABZ2M1L4_9BACT
MGSLMLQEALASASVVSAQSREVDQGIQALARTLRERPPSVALTVARGSSDHAANYFAYLTMSELGVPVVSLPMSLVTLNHAPLVVDGQLAISVSQSGQSPDLVETMSTLRARGATTVAFVNRTESPLAEACQWTVPLSAGPERSVAATKSYIGALSALARLVAHWREDPKLLAALGTLPARLEEATQSDGGTAVDALAVSDRAMVVGRGLGFAVALEAALKLKETSSIQAEAFSGAEIRHGPMALIEQGYPLFVFALRGAEQKGLIELAEEMRGRGARVILAAPADIQGRDVTLAVADDESLDPILAIQTFYLIAARVAEMRGFNPDVPRHLSKVTHTR